MSSAKWREFRHGRNVLMDNYIPVFYYLSIHALIPMLV